MRAEILAVLAIVALGTSGAMAQTTGDSSRRSEPQTGGTGSRSVTAG